MEYLRSKNAPELQGAVAPESLFYWQAYHHLRGSRHTDGGRIPFSEIAGYSDWLGMTCPVDKGRLARMIIMLDNAEREHHGRVAAGD